MDRINSWELRVLVICDEWTPTRGGISTFNRELASTLARLGFPVMCQVKSATRTEIKDAQERGIRLVSAARTPDGPNMSLFADTVREFSPHVVIGHDHVSGSIAWTYAKKHFPESALVHIIHSVPPELEPHKDRPGAQRRIEEREQMTQSIAVDAAVVAAVGPRVARYAQSVVGDGYGGVRVLQLDPGMDVPERARAQRREIPASPTVILLGRAKDIELKGLDIAAQALAGLTVPGGRPMPVLLVRGAEDANCDMVRERLVELAGLSRDRVDVRLFTPDANEIRHSLRRAVLSVLPSRVEPFGLVAYESIALGTPVLLTDRSGVAETLRHQLGRVAEPMVVQTADDRARHVANWTTAMQRVFDDLPAAFAYAHEVRDRLAGVLSWEGMASALMARLSLPAGCR